jgi:hypothetical protein
LLAGYTTLTPGTTYTISVGAGGSASASTGSNSSTGSAGTNSTISGLGFTTITAVGGGTGAAFYTNAATTGGSGGGGNYFFVPGSATSGQGYAGGAGGNVSTGYYIGGGGGGAGGAGGAASTTPGVGGIGATSSITGSSVYYAGGGGGGGDTRTTTGSVSSISSGNYISGTSPNFVTSWTVEFWAYSTVSGTQQTFVSFGNGLNIWKNPSNQLVVDDGNTGQSAWTGVTIPLNQWVHIAVVKNGTTTTGYINGAVTGSHTFTPQTISTFIVGTFWTASYSFTGSISNVRVVNGTAVYTSAFTPPTSPLPKITNTSLLTCLGTGFFDASGNNYTVTKTGNPALSTTSPFTASTANIAGASGGTGGGGSGGGSNGNATAGTANQGGGGGGGAYLNYAAASGGSGVVVISLSSAATLTTGSPTVTTSGGRTIYTFTGSGTITP